MTNDSVQKTILVATTLCLVCSVLVSGTAVVLKERQQKNRLLDKRKNILVTAGLAKSDEDIDVEALYKKYIEEAVIDFEEDEMTDVDASTYNQRKAAKDPERNIRIDKSIDLAGIKQMAKKGLVYFVRKEGAIQQVIIPVHGKGLWSTLYGFLAFDRDLNTIKGLSFYEHAETPGLGGEVDNPNWKQKWIGKKAFDEKGDVAIEVIKGQVSGQTQEPEYKVDGLSGATITSRGVSALLNFWLGEEGYGPFMDKLEKKLEAGFNG